jgi:hypothetical protein
VRGVERPRHARGAVAAHGDGVRRYNVVLGGGGNFKVDWKIDLVARTRVINLVE